MIICFPNFLVNCGWWISLERQVAWYKNIQKNPKGPYICLGSIITIQHFWCHIEGSTCNRCKFFIAFVDFWETKVNKSNWSIICYHNILWLDVTMNDTLGVAMVHCLEKFFHVDASFSFIESLVRHACNFVKELHPLDVFHHQVYVLGIVVCFKILNDVWMIKFV